METTSEDEPHPELAACCDDAARSLVESIRASTPNTRELEIPERFQLEGDLRGTPVRVRSRAFPGDAIRYARVTRMDGGRHAQALNALWLPVSDRVAPILTCELLVLRGHLHLLLCDAHPLAETDADHEASISVARTWTDAFESGLLRKLDAMSPPTWGEPDEPPAFSDRALFTKPGAAEGHDPRPGARCLETVATRWAEVVRSSDVDDDRSSERRSRRASLLAIHRRCEPTAEFLGRLSDDETIRYMTRSYLYPTWIEDETEETPDWSRP